MISHNTTALPALVASCDGQGVLAFFARLSHSRQREASRVLEREAAKLSSEDFWTLTLCLVKQNSKAFLGTLLKVAPERIGDGFAAWLSSDGTEIDIIKTVDALLPRQKNPESIELLFTRLGIMSPLVRAKYLVQSLTQPSAFVLFQCMRQMEAERDWLLALCRRLVHDGTTIGWVLASLARTYFDLPELRGTFSLNLQPYELSHIENSYDAFCRLQ